MTRHARADQCPPLTVATATPGALEIVAVPIAPTQATVQVQGELDAAAAPVLAAALHEQLAQGYRFVRLDLSRLRFLDCAGLQILVTAHNQFLIAHGTLVLTGVDHRTARLLCITHLDEALFVADGPGEPRRVRHLTSVPTDATT